MRRASSSSSSLLALSKIFYYGDNNNRMMVRRQLSFYSTAESISMVLYRNRSRFIISRPFNLIHNSFSSPMIPLSLSFHSATKLTPQRQQQQQQQQPSKRCFSTSPSEDQEAMDFLVKIGHDDPNIARGVITALKEAGVNGSALLPMIKALAGRWEVGEDAGLEDLVEAVRVNQLKQEGRTQIQLLVIPANAWKSSEEDAEDYADIVETPEEYEEALKRAFPVEAMTGLSLTDVAKHGDGPGAQHLGESIECACAGIMACSTCHVIIDPKWFDKGIVDKPGESELDMLDLAYAPRRTSRLACQIVLDESMDGMVIRLPKGSNNLMDFVPFSE
ncbi:2Fe-2S ferredoxin [Nitzschia inconspicua]|uniref:2Fe-2S ferredoxin n=1 Tax=Nitzschia inconspicua TaxID=303405 RepID=A0A9K3PVC1_9STRA|nr:2Fe-2S ferredoxin [Nitzschia inconspicua]